MKKGHRVSCHQALFLWNFNWLLGALQSDLNWCGDSQGEVPAYWTLLSKVNNLERYGRALGVSGGKRKLELSWKSPSWSSESPEDNRCGVPGVMRSPGPQTQLLFVSRLWMKVNDDSGN